MNVSGAEERALQYWGYLFQRNKLPTERLDRLLYGIAECIVSAERNSHAVLPSVCYAFVTGLTLGSRGYVNRRHFEPSGSSDLSPAALGAFYHAVGGNYDLLFRDTAPQSIAFIYRSLGCLHSLQPGAKEDGYSVPSVPALKSRGFVTWQSIQLLLGPEEHVPFLQSALKVFDVRDPVDGTSFPKLLPSAAFPQKPDAQMVAWHEGVSKRLRHDAEVTIDSDTRLVTNAPHSGNTDEKANGTLLLDNQLAKDRQDRPAVTRRFNLPKPPEKVMEGGKSVVSTLRQIVDPNLFGGTRRRSLPDKTESPEKSDEDEAPPSGGRMSRRRSPAPRPRTISRREQSPHTPGEARLQTADRPRRHHSQDLASSARGQEQQERQGQRPKGPARHDSEGQSFYKLDRGAPFISSMSAPVGGHRSEVQSNSPSYFDQRRPPGPQRGSSMRSGGKAPCSPGSGLGTEPLPLRAQEPQQGQSAGLPPPRRASSAGSRHSPLPRHVIPVDGVGGRRYPNEAPWN